MYDPIRQFRYCVHVSDSGGAMKREELLSLASDIFDYKFRENTPQFARIEQLAKRIAAHEREECARLCESLFDMEDGSCCEAEKCAEAIRARSE